MPQKKAVATEFGDMLDDFALESCAFSKCSPDSRTWKTRIEAARRSLVILAGSEAEVEIISLLVAILKKSERMMLWNKLSGNFPVAFQDLELGVKRTIVRELGWTQSMFKPAGLKVGDALFASRNGCGTSGRPTTITDEDEEQMAKTLEMCSSPLSRLVKNAEGEETPVRGMSCTYREAYEKSGLEGTMSYSSFYKRIGPQYKHTTRRTDVCEYCLAGEHQNSKLKQIVATHPKKFIDAEWHKSKPDPSLLVSCLSSGHKPPSNLLAQVEPIVQDLKEVQLHKEIADIQKAAYNEDVNNPPDGTVVVTLDFKSKGNSRRDLLSLQNSSTTREVTLC